MESLVSIIVTTFNSSKYVLESLKNTKTQSYQNIELIISDDCYTDDTVDICKAFGLDNTTLLLQTIYGGANIYVLEFAPRICGGDNFNNTRDATGCDIIDVAIDFFLNNKFSYSYHNSTQY